MRRRRFLHALGTVPAGLALAGCATHSGTSTMSPSAPAHAPLIVSTWPFGKAANERALQVLRENRPLLDAVVEGITVTELDLGVDSVGAGGRPNSEGVVSLDACIMDGPTHRCGSVGGMEGVVPAIAVARAVMEKTRHVMLVGDGARRFALSQGFQERELITDAQRAAWQEWRRQHPPENPLPPLSHDTIALLVLGEDGNLVGGCSTSGLAYKLPGRVGDSPIIGSGLYVDNEVGAAGATGVGENIMRFCGSFQVVELMRAGATPAEACAETIRRIQRKHPAGADLAVNFVALDRKGRFGAAGTGKGFPYAVTYPGRSEVLASVAVPHRAS